MGWDPDDGEVERLRSQDRAWVSDDDISALLMERLTGAKTDGDSESPTAQARRMIQEASPMAAASLVRLAQHSEHDSIRMRAALEILNRAEAMGATVDGKEPWAELIDTTSVEAHANKGGEK